jgi:hypothetical protein
MAVVVDREWAVLVSYFLRIYCEILTDTARREFFAPEIRELLVLMSLTTFAKQKRSMRRVEFAKIVNPQSFVIHIALVATLVAFESSAFAQNAPNMPPRNPWLTDSVYPTSHFNPAATDSVLFSRTDDFDELLDLGEVPNDLLARHGLARNAACARKFMRLRSLFRGDTKGSERMPRQLAPFGRFNSPFLSGPGRSARFERHVFAVIKTA